MNLIPLVSFFLLLLAFFSTSFLEQETALVSEEKYFYSYYQLELKRRNEGVSKQFKKWKSPEKTTKPVVKASLHDVAPIKEKKLRKMKNPSERAKFNFTLLLKNQDHPNYPLLYETAARLIKGLYKNGDFFHREKDLEYTLLDLMIEEGLKEDDFSFRVMLKDNPYKEDFYKMQQGIKTYSLEEGKGYPPFEEFFTLSTAKINFDYATSPLLEAFFTPPLFKKILELEEKKEKGNFLTQKELETFLKDDPSLLDSKSFLEFLHFGFVKDPYLHLSSKDEKTNIVLTGKVKKIDSN